jgi:Carboxypeptidase regulatory-like domain/TonB dependent receptor-like, beta-barrel
MFCRLHTLLVSFFLVTWCSMGYAQSAQIQGQVTDSAGASLSSAKVRVVDQNTGIERQTRTNSGGQYAVPALNPSLYKIFVEASGFSTAVSDVITLNVEQNAVFDFKLKVGSASSQVEVNASDSDIDTTDASVSTVIDRQFVENLPLNGRSFQSLINLTPGVAQNYAAHAARDYATGQFTINGQRGSSNYWTVDGVSANIGVVPYIQTGNGTAGGLGAFNVLGGTNSMVSVDALQEFRIQTSTYAPEFGRTPGGQISILTRSGSNQFHGGLFDYFRNAVLDAGDWFANHEGLPKAEEKQNDFGGVVGGPIFKDKTFFFFSYEGLRLRLPQTLLTTVPSLAVRQASIPAMRPYVDAFPVPAPGVPDVPGSPGLAPFNATISSPSSVNAFSLRLDQELNKNLSVFARYNYSPSSYRARANDGAPLNDIFLITSNTKTATLGVTWAASSMSVNEARFNYSAAGGQTSGYEDTFGGGVPPTIDGLIPSPYTTKNASLSFGTSFGTNMGYLIGPNANSVQHQYNLVDTFSIQKAAHSLKFGADYRRLTPSLQPVGYFLIPVFFTVEEMETGLPSLTIIWPSVSATYLFKNLSAFAQDTWRIHPRLTMTYGLRWDVDFTPRIKTGPSLTTVTGFSLTDLSNLALAPAGTPIYNTSYGGLAPRIGLSYQISPNPDRGQVLRTGFGVYYDLASTEVGNSTIGYYPISTTVVLSGIPFPTPLADATAPPIIPPDATQGSLLGFDPHLKLPYSLQWSAALEQSLGRAQTLTLTYVGAAGKRLLATEAVTNPNPNYANAILVGNAGSSNYNALQLQFKRRLSRGLQVLASYSWAHSIDTGSYGAYTNGSFADANGNRAVSDFDIRDTFSTALTYDVPTWKRDFFTRAVLGGWSTQNVIQLASAPPVDVVDGAFAALTHTNSQIQVRPDIVPGQPFYLYGSQYPGGKALNPSAFTDPPVDPISGTPLRQGNLSRNAMRAFGLGQYDFGVHREFPVNEQVRLQFRAEMFNVLNHPNFAPYNAKFNAGDPYFGQTTSMLNQGLGNSVVGNGSFNAMYQIGGPRSVQLALKLSF